MSKLSRSFSDLIAGFELPKFGRSGNGPADERRLRLTFWGKLKRIGASLPLLLPFAEDLLSAYYCAFDRKTPGHVKAALLAALAYFVLPTDAVPDFLPLIGFSDDAAVLAAAMKLVSGYVTPEHRMLAKAKLARLSRFTSS